MRGRLLALNSRNTLSSETTWSLWPVPIFRALHLCDSSCLDATVAEYSLSEVCVATLIGAPVWCECGPVELHCLVDVVTDGSRDGDLVGWSAVIVSPKGVVAEAWSWCAMVGASLWVAKWCGKPLALWLLGELGLPLSPVRSFVVDNTWATYGEDGSRASHYTWVDTLRLQYAAAWM